MILLFIFNHVLSFEWIFNLFIPLEIDGNSLSKQCLEATVFTESLTKYKAYNLTESNRTLPQKLMVSLQMEVFRQEPWGLAIIYLDAEGRKCLTGYRLSKLRFVNHEDQVDIESPSCGICQSLVFVPNKCPIRSVIYLLIFLLGI